MRLWRDADVDEGSGDGARGFVTTLAIFRTVLRSVDLFVRARLDRARPRWKTGVL